MRKINVLTLEYNETNNSINLINPPYKDLTQYYNFDNNKTTILYKQGKIYENIVYATQTKGNPINEYMFLPTKKIYISENILKILYFNESKDDYSSRTPELYKLNYR